MRGILTGMTQAIATADHQHCDDPQIVEQMIARDTFLRQAVLDIQEYDDTLVLMVAPNVPHIFVRTVVRQIWAGPIEIYCATALMAGAEVG